jgi:hypothetical protein
VTARDVQQAHVGGIRTRERFDVLAAHEFGPLKSRTIQNALKTLSGEGSAEAAGMRGFATLWRAATLSENLEVF